MPLLPRRFCFSNRLCGCSSAAARDRGGRRERWRTHTREIALVCLVGSSSGELRDQCGSSCCRSASWACCARERARTRSQKESETARALDDRARARARQINAAAAPTEGPANSATAFLALVSLDRSSPALALRAPRCAEHPPPSRAAQRVKRGERQPHFLTESTRCLSCGSL